MPDYNRPEDFASIINDLQRRVRVLERSARVLPSSTVIPTLAPSNGSGVSLLTNAVRPVAYDGTPRTTAVRTADSVTVAMPTVQATGSKILVVYSFRWSGVGTGGPFYSDEWSLNVRCDGVSGGITWLWNTSGYDGVLDQIIELRAGVFDVVSGDHTFAVYLTAEANPGASSPTIHAQVQAQSLSVIPLVP